MITVSHRLLGVGDAQAGTEVGRHRLRVLLREMPQIRLRGREEVDLVAGSGDEAVDGDADQVGESAHRDSPRWR
jgi:hypothetical protein